MEKINIQSLSDDKFLDIVQQLQQSTISEDGIIRKLSIQYYGNEAMGIIMLPMLLLRILAERMTRLKTLCRDSD